jgi:hypothetical protein
MYGQGSYGQGMHGQGGQRQSEYDPGQSGRGGYEQGGYWQGGAGQGGYGQGWSGEGGYGEGRVAWPEQPEMPESNRGGDSWRGRYQHDYQQGQQGQGQRGMQRGQFAGRGPKGYQRSDDRIREDVNEELTRNPEIDATEIEVKVENGEVTLTGVVDARQTKRLAEDLAERCSGVHEVHNQLRVNRGHSGSEGATGETKSRTGRSTSSATTS